MILNRTQKMCNKEDQVDVMTFLLSLADQNAYGYIGIKLFHPNLQPRVNELFDHFQLSGVIDYEGLKNNKYYYNIIMNDDQIARALSVRSAIDRILLGF